MDYRRGKAFPCLQPLPFCHLRFARISNRAGASVTPSNGLQTPARNTRLFAVSRILHLNLQFLRREEMGKSALAGFVEPSARVRSLAYETKSDATWGMFFYDLLQGVRGMGRLGHFVSLAALRVAASPQSQNPPCSLRSRGFCRTLCEGSHP